jgi:hypothetical protein
MDDKLIEENSSSYKKFLDSFLFNIQSLRLYTKSVGPVLSKISNNKKFKNEKLIVDVINLLYSAEYEENLSETEIEDINKIKGLLQNNFGIEYENKKVIAKGSKAIGLLRKIDHYKVNLNQNKIMNQSSLISLIIFFELLIGSIIKYRLMKYPKAFEDLENKTLTLEEIRRLGSLENAELYLIEQEVETILRKKYQDWIIHLRKSNSVKLEFLNSFDIFIVEIFQRRNLFVHNEGIVNNIYLKNVDPSLTKKVERESNITITKDYLENSINIIEHVGVLLCLEIWGSMEKKSPIRTEFIQTTGYNYMETGHWELARDMFKINLNEKQITNRLKTMSQINYWLSMKELNNFNQCVNEINSSDFTDKSLDYQLCLFALSENKEKFFEIIPKAISTKAVSFDELNEWLVLKPMRTDERFSMALESFKDNAREQ